MKTIFILIFLFTCSYLYSQVPATWDPKVQTYIPYVGGTTYAERVAIFTNHYGIHVLKLIHDGIPIHVKYFRLTSEGERPGGFPVEGISLDSYGNFPNIVGDERSLQMCCN